MEVHFKPLNTGGVLQVKLDGNLVIDYSGDTTNNAEYVTEFVLRGTDQGKETYYDDIVLNDASGSYNNSWPGQVHLLPIQAAGEGDTTQFTRAGVDLGENFAQVRPLTPIQSYVQSDTADEIDLYTVDVPDLPSGATIKNVIASALGRIVTGSGSMALLCKQGGNTTTGSDKALSAGWTMDQEVFAVNPADDAAWEEADLSGLQLGIKSR